jgi:two-component system sensor histidine kinase/response regulator
MHVDCVASAYRALESLRLAHRDGRTYDVAILDHQMPDMDGIMLARTIKSDRALAAIPLVPLTSVSYGGCAAEAKEAGFSAFLIKPIRQSQLYDCIASVMHIAGESAPQRLITQETLPETQSRPPGPGRRGQRRVDVVANGLEALEALARIAYDCVLMDCQMPEMDGFEATKMIRRREARTGSHVSIVAMTANAMDLRTTLEKWIQPAPES